MCYTLDEIRQKSSEIASKYNMNKLVLFGSYARGEASDDSDIDLMIQSDDMGLLDISRFKQQLADSFNTPIDVIREEDVSDVFRFLIKDDEILIYEK